MLKGWNRKVRMTSAMMRALKSTRIVSAMPPSFFLVPVCTLIGPSSCGRPAPRSCNLSIPQAQLRARFHRAVAQRGFIERLHVLATKPTKHDEFFIAAMDGSYSEKAESNGSNGGPSSSRHGDGRNDDESVGRRSLVGDGEVDARFVAGGRDRVEAPFGAAGELHGRPPRRQVDDAHVAPPHAGADAGAERLGAGLLGGEALGIGLDPVAPPFGARPLGRRENAVDEAIAVTLDHLGDAAHVGNVGADAEDHRAAPLLRRPRSIAARILRTTSPRPPKIASPIRKCPILSSAISGKAAIVAAVRKSRPWPAWTSRPTPLARFAPRTMRSNSAVPAAASPAAKASHQAPV